MRFRTYHTVNALGTFSGGCRKKSNNGYMAAYLHATRGRYKTHPFCAT